MNPAIGVQYPKMPNDETLGVGLYSLAEAARLLRTPRRTVSRWVDGYVQVLQSGPREYAPVIASDDYSALTFGDLVELMYVRGFRDAGVGLDMIRTTAAKFRNEWDTRYPLATERFATDGRSLLLGLGGDWKHALTGQHMAFFDELGTQLVHLNNLTAEWRPLGVDHLVLVNPDRSFGKPIEAGSGAHTYVLAQAAAGSEDIDSVAWWYGTTTQGVKDASQFEEQYKAA